MKTEDYLSAHLILVVQFNEANILKKQNKDNCNVIIMANIDSVLLMKMRKKLLVIEHSLPTKITHKIMRQQLYMEEIQSMKLRNT
jgi:hypothetical protein